MSVHDIFDFGDHKRILDFRTIYVSCSHRMPRAAGLRAGGCMHTMHLLVYYYN